MTLVQNLLRPLNGNSYLFAIFILLAVVSCSSVFKKGETTIPDTDSTTVVHNNHLADVLIETNDANADEYLSRTWKVALILPFHLNSIDFYDLETEVNPKAILALTFYEGALLALDSLKKLGLNFEIRLYDTQRDTLALKRILAKPELKQMDIIVGPVYSDNLDITARFARKNNIPMLSPLSPNKSNLAVNKFMLMLTPTIETHCENLVRHIKQNYSGATIVLAYSPYLTEDEKSFKNSIKTALDSTFSRSGADANYREFIQSAVNSAEFDNLLSDTGQNIVLMPSLSESYVSLNLGRIRRLVKKRNIIVYGLPLWLRFESIDIKYFESLGVHLTNNWFVDYEDPEIKTFRKKYIETYNIEPSKYAYKGYDTFFFLGKLCLNCGLNFDLLPRDLTWVGLSSEYNLRPVEVNGIIQRYENSYVNILRFKEFSLISIN
ncbi:MAG: amino acid ABC transporter substrate-binding protein [Bacteroidetes bacterium]|nr:amino acid ABC transporter substrate-binding protein [Bacteroidota bacterium]